MYQNLCLTCQEGGKKVLYIGETRVSGFERCNQHHKDEVGKHPEKSHIHVHKSEEHPDMDPDKVRFQFKILKKIRTPFQRQITEAVLIRLKTRENKETLLNNKQEFSRCVLPELQTTMQDKIVSQNISKEVSENMRDEDLELESEQVLNNKKRHRENHEKPKSMNNKKIKLDTKM